DGLFIIWAESKLVLVVTFSGGDLGYLNGELAHIRRSRDLRPGRDSVRLNVTDELSADGFKAVVSLTRGNWTKARNGDLFYVTASGKKVVMCHVAPSVRHFDGCSMQRDQI